MISTLRVKISNYFFRIMIQVLNIEQLQIDNSCEATANSYNLELKNVVLLFFPFRSVVCFYELQKIVAVSNKKTDWFVHRSAYQFKASHYVSGIDPRDWSCVRNAALVIKGGTDVSHHHKRQPGCQRRRYARNTVHLSYVFSRGILQNETYVNTNT